MKVLLISEAGCQAPESSSSVTQCILTATVRPRGRGFSKALKALGIDFEAFYVR